MLDAVLLWDVRAKLAEGPLWVERESALYVVDILTRDVHRIYPSSGATSTWHFDQQLTGLAPMADGRFVSTTRHGFAVVDFVAETVSPIATVDTEPATNRFNDAKADRFGTFWAGTMDEGEAKPSGALYRLGRDGVVTQVDAGYTIANGPAFSTSGDTMFHTDSFRRTIFAFDVDGSGGIANKRIFASFDDPNLGAPDGMTVDEENCLWVCHFGGARVSRFAPSGELIGGVNVPVPNVTSCTFGGEGYQTMFITTARVAMNEAALAASPLAGGIFTANVGVAGLAANQYGGFD